VDYQGLTQKYIVTILQWKPEGKMKGDTMPKILITTTRDNMTEKAVKEYLQDMVKEPELPFTQVSLETLLKTGVVQVQSEQPDGSIVSTLIELKKMPGVQDG
jgi:hypothetical protein